MKIADRLPNNPRMTEEMVEWIDGFLLGDGHIQRPQVASSTVCCAKMGSSHKEWSEYGLSGLAAYCASPAYPSVSRDENGVEHSAWQTYTLSHNDLFLQRQRWYPQDLKRVPSDVRITRTSLLLWYLGDGSLDRERYATICIPERDFPKQDVVDHVLPKLAEKFDLKPTIQGKGKSCKLYFGADLGQTRLFFDTIGRECPPEVSCYQYKFAVRPLVYLPNESDVARELKVGRSWLAWAAERFQIPVQKDGGAVLYSPEAVELARKIRDERYDPRAAGLEGSGTKSRNDLRKEFGVRYDRLVEAIQVAGLSGSRFSAEDVEKIKVALPPDLRKSEAAQERGRSLR